MEKNAEAAQPPPYETLTSSSKPTSARVKLSVPPPIMTKIMAIRPHAERMRLTKAYIAKKGRVVENREAARTRQERGLEDALKQVKRDVRGVQATRSRAVWHIGDKCKGFWKGYFYASEKYIDWKAEGAETAMLIAAGEEEARSAYEKEIPKIEAEFRDAVKQLDEEFMAYVERLLAEAEGSEESK